MVELYSTALIQGIPPGQGIFVDSKENKWLRSRKDEREIHEVGDLGEPMSTLLNGLRSLPNWFLGLFGYELFRKETIKDLRAQVPVFDDFGLAYALRKHNVAEFLEYMPQSKAQLRQDLLALVVSGFKRDGFFVEFGATDGVSLSNSYMLEKAFNWNGILAEPGRVWHENLKLNRKSIVDTRCVWKASREVLPFLETTRGELSTLASFVKADFHALSRRENKSYEVNTVSLLDLLVEHNAPSYIDYLSIDTEGSELESLNAFDFNKYRFGVITCEHNYSDSREKVLTLLTENGYRRVLKSLSLWDDWYVHQTISIEL